MTQQEFSAISSTIPTQPGIYKYYDASNKLIYVGKAKHLRKRVSSYFSKSATNYKTRELVNRIRRIEFTIVNSEQDAFLLENSLIKEFQPLFNINLKDDKTYPFIVIKNEPFPRVFLTRRKIEDGSQYFGPFTSVAKVRDLLDFIKQNIQLRTCKLNLTKSNIEKKKFRVCLEYHLGNCKGPCEGYQSEHDYREGLEQLKQLIRGNLSPVINYFRKEIQKHSEALEFEKAAILQDKIRHLQQYQARSAVVNINTGSLDVFNILEEGDIAYVNYLSVNNGSVVQTKTLTLEKKLEESKEEVLAFAIARIRQTFNSEAKEIVVPFHIEYAEENCMLTVPKGGDKKKLLDLSATNVNHFQQELQARKILKLEERSAAEVDEILAQMKEDLQLRDVPVHIECFDNSNFQGSYPVSAMVCFKDGLPSKKDYRHFNIKTVTGINDFASMKEVVFRRYKRLIDEGASLPQLVIIDGGKGQLSSAMESINQLGLKGKMTVIGLAKSQEEIFYPGDTIPVRLAWNSESLKLIRRIRDEVHRFGITFHRNKRSKGALKNELEQIPGIGKHTADQLLKEFRSLKNVRTLSLQALETTIGKARARIVYDALHREEKEKGPG